jgi:hypothetical protein
LIASGRASGARAADSKSTSANSATPAWRRTIRRHGQTPDVGQDVDRDRDRRQRQREVENQLHRRQLQRADVPERTDQLEGQGEGEQRQRRARGALQPG